MKWFKNLNATPRLMLGFGILMALIVGIAYLSVNSLSAANDRVKQLYQQDMRGAVASANMTIARMSLGRQGRDAILNISDPVIFDKNKKTMLADFDSLHSNLALADKCFYTKEGMAAIADVRNTLPAYEKAYHDLYERVGARDLAGAKQALATVNEVGKPLYAGVDRARALKDVRGAEKFEANSQAFSSARSLILTTSAAALILGIILSIVIARGFSVPLGKAVAVLEQVASGDLTASLDLDTDDEVGRMAASLNDTLAKLRTTLQGVADSASAASTSSHELAAASEAIASGSQEQAASLEETAASLEQITATVRQSADNARQASQLAIGSRNSAEQGQEVVSSAVTAMAEINESSAKIFDIISTIDEIAFQTNLLAVNAAVEAARAGEEGRGFAVVASEVRSLAQRSAGAAKEIKGLIQDSLRKVQKGTELVNRSGETLQGIVTSVKRVTDIVGEIALATGEQSTGIEQVNSAMAQMDQVTQSNSAQTEELSGTAQALSEQAAHLLQLVSTFTLRNSDNDPGNGAQMQAHGSVPQRSKPEVRRGSSSQATTSNFRERSATANVRNGKAHSRPASDPRGFGEAARSSHGNASLAITAHTSRGVVMTPAVGTDDASFEEF